MKKHWRGVVTTAAFGVCVVASAGVCIVAGVAAATANAFHKKKNGGIGWSRKAFARDAAWAVGGGALGRAFSTSWKASAIARRPLPRHSAKARKRGEVNVAHTVRNMKRNASLGGMTIGLADATNAAKKRHWRWV